MPNFPSDDGDEFWGYPDDYPLIEESTMSGSSADPDDLEILGDDE